MELTSSVLADTAQECTELHGHSVNWKACKALSGPQSLPGQVSASFLCLAAAHLR